MRSADKRAYRTAIYRFYGENDTLLYVGITNDLLNRWRWHEKHSEWWRDQLRVEVKWHETRELADAEETRAVRTEQPLHNQQKRGKTPIRTFRLEPQVWEDFGRAAAAMGMTRTGVLRQMLEHAVGRPGVNLPPRPPANWRDLPEFKRT